MVKVIIHRERCKGCGLCLAHCPKGLLAESPEFNEAGYRPVMQTEPEKCTGCGLCAVMCPDVCFTIYKISDVAGSVRGAAE